MLSLPLTYAPRRRQRTRFLGFRWDRVIPLGGLITFWAAIACGALRAIGSF